jgi:HEPN domain-containing protein
MNPKQTEISCYHCQQAAEKALKGYLVFREAEPPKSHNLVQLCQLCIDFDKSFGTIIDICSDLTQFSSGVRYPYELSPNDSIAEGAISKAQKVYVFCTSKIPWINHDDLKEHE